MGWGASNSFLFSDFRETELIVGEAGMKDMPRKLKSRVVKGIIGIACIPFHQRLGTVARGTIIRKGTTHEEKLAFFWLLILNLHDSLLAFIIPGVSVEGNSYCKRMAFAVTLFPSVYCTGSSQILVSIRVTWRGN